MCVYVCSISLCVYSLYVYVCIICIYIYTVASIQCLHISTHTQPLHHYTCHIHLCIQHTCINITIYMSHTNLDTSVHIMAGGQRYRISDPLPTRIFSVQVSSASTWVNLFFTHSSGVRPAGIFVHGPNLGETKQTSFAEENDDIPSGIIT